MPKLPLVSGTETVKALQRLSSGNVAVMPSCDVENVVALSRCTAKLTPALCEASYGKPM